MKRLLVRTIVLSVGALGIAGCADDRRDAAAAPNPQPLADLQDRQADDNKMETFTGTLESGVMAIGGETTGWRLIGDGESGALELDVSRIADQAEKLDGRRVTITGQVTTRQYIERGEVTVLVARCIQLAE